MLPARTDQVCGWSSAAAPSYFHGWSPDGKFLSFVANRDGKQYDLYRVPGAGGAEERLTVDSAYDDGTDYSRDGRWIYFNSNRGGGWNIWRIPSDGAGADDRKAQQVTATISRTGFRIRRRMGAGCCFSPFRTARRVTIIATRKCRFGSLRCPVRRCATAEPRVLLELQGGQGTINVNSWSPDSKHFAYVTFQVKRSRSMMLEPRVQALVEKVWGYHQLGHSLSPADAILVLCSHDEVVAERPRSFFSTAGRRC